MYVCGHLHTLGGVGKHMYAKHAEGFMELELADWKHARGYVTSDMSCALLIHDKYVTSNIVER